VSWIGVPTPLLCSAHWAERREDREFDHKLLTHVRRHGQMSALVVRKLDGKYEVVDGNRRLVAFREAGLEKVVCVSVGEVTKEEAYRLHVELNELQSYTHHVTIAALLHALPERSEELAATLPFTPSRIDAYREYITGSWDAYDDEEADDGRQQGLWED
jgi:ParB-like chromosome segregation protein Spo0J